MKRTVAVLVVVIVAVVIAVAITWSLEPGHGGQRTATSDVVHEAAVRASAPGRAAPSPVTRSQAPARRADASFGTFVRDPAIERRAERAKVLGELAVLSAARRRELQSLYADEALIFRQSERILRPDPQVDRSAPREGRAGSYTFAHVSGSLPAEGEAERMDAVRYMSDALRWRDNPARDLVAEEIERVLLEDSITDTLHPGVRRGMMGDKIELYSILAREHPERANALAGHGASPRVEKLLVMARNYARAGYTYDGIGRPRAETAQRAR